MSDWQDIVALEIRPRAGLREHPTVQAVLEFLGVDKADWTRLGDARAALHQAMFRRQAAEAAYRRARLDEMRETQRLAEGLQARGAAAREARRRLRDAMERSRVGLAELETTTAEVRRKQVLEAACRAAMMLRDPRKAQQVLVHTDTAWVERDPTGAHGFWGRGRLSA